MKTADVLPVLLVFVISCGRIGFDALQGDDSSSMTGGGGTGAGTGSGGAGGTSGSGGGGAPTGDAGGTGGARLDGGAGQATGGGASTGGFGGSAGAPPDAGGSGAGGAAVVDGGFTCTPGAAELCDGRDNNCDLVIDESACGVGCTGYASPTHGYMLCNSNYKWDEAKATCEAAGLELARIDSSAENDFITAFAFGSRSTDLWLGGTDAATEGDWRWTDGTAFWSGLASPAGSAVGGAYAGWLSTEPDGLSNSGTDADCLSLRQDGVWVDQGCNYFERILCRTP